MLQSAAKTYHEILRILEIAEAIAGVDIDMARNKGFECERLIESLITLLD